MQLRCLVAADVSKHCFSTVVTSSQSEVQTSRAQTSRGSGGFTVSAAILLFRLRFFTTTDFMLCNNTDICDVF